MWRQKKREKHRKLNLNLKCEEMAKKQKKNLWHPLRQYIAGKMKKMKENIEEMRMGGSLCMLAASAPG
jgi:hypothetical protein